MFCRELIVDGSFTCSPTSMFLGKAIDTFDLWTTMMRKGRLGRASTVLFDPCKRFFFVLYDNDSTINVPFSLVRTITGASHLGGYVVFFATAQIDSSSWNSSSLFALTSLND